MYGLKNQLKSAAMWRDNKEREREREKNLLRKIAIGAFLHPKIRLATKKKEKSKKKTQNDLNYTCHSARR